MDSTGLVVAGLYRDGTSWLPADLYVRNQANDRGLGVCNPNEFPCPGPDGGGDVNELDNAGTDELIRLTLPSGYEWVSVQLSSLDNNGGSPLEHGRLWADADGDPTALDTVLWSFKGDGPEEPVFAIPGSAANANYLFFQPIDWESGRTHNNDFLVYQASIQRSVPEPGTLVLLWLGLLSVSGLRRKR